MARKIETVNSAVAHIERHLDEKLDLDAVAQAVHYSKYHLHRIFTETVGITLHDYVQRRQLTEAAKLLVFSVRPIVEIAHIAGYENQQAFTTVFREMYKLTPNQFREREEFYPLQLKYDFGSAAKGGNISGKGLRIIRPADEEDIPAWMELVHMVIDGFPNLQEAEHCASLKRYIGKSGAFIMTEGEKAVGGMLLGYPAGSIDFMAVHPLYRSQGVNRQFLERALSELLDKKEIRITTFREGDKADTGYRKALKELGFAEGGLLTEFGYPTQEMILPSMRTSED